MIRSPEERLREDFAEYADHQSWRCEHPDRYPWDPDCPCGLVEVERRVSAEERRRGLPGRVGDLVARLFDWLARRTGADGGRE